MATWKVQLEIESSAAPARITATTTAVGEEQLVDVLNEGMDAVVDIYEDEDDDDVQADRIKHIVGNDTCCAACAAAPLRPVQGIQGEPLRGVPVRLVVLG